MQKGAIWWTPNQCVLNMEFESVNVIILKRISDWKINLGIH